MITKKLASNVLTGIFVALFAWYAYNNQSTLSSLFSISLTTILLVATGKLVMHAIQGLFTKWTAEVFTERFTFGESIYVGVLSAVGNFFGPLLGGAGIRATYLKKSHGLAYNKFASTMLGYYLVLFTLNSLVAVVALLAIEPSRQTQLLMVGFSGWLAILIVLMFIKLPARSKVEARATNKHLKSLTELVYGIESGWHRILRTKGLLIKLFCLSVANFLAVIFLSYVEFAALGVSPGIASLSLYSVFITVSLLISITPGAIGIREALLIVVAGTLGISNSEIIQVAVIDRGVNFLLLMLLFALIRIGYVKRLLTSKEAAF